MNGNGSETFSVRELRAKLQEKIGETVAEFKITATEFTRPSRSAPVVPPHRSPVPVPTPNGVRASGKRPQIAPKPLHLHAKKTTDQTPTSVSANCALETSPPPSIVVSPSEFPEVESCPVKDTGADETICGDVRGRAKMFEDMGFIPRSPPSANNERPLSEISTLSVTSAGDYDAESSGSEDEKLRRGSFLSRQAEDQTFVAFSLPETKTTVDSRHADIMNEMQRKGLIRNSYMDNRRRKSLTQSELKPSSSAQEIELPSDVGRVREEKGRQDHLTVSSPADFADDSSRLDSMMSDRSSISTAQSIFSENVPDYDTGDPDEDKRLKRLHYAAIEFTTVQRAFVVYLRDMTGMYPNYLEEYGKRMGIDLLAPLPNGQENVVRQIQKILLQLQPFHELLLEQFTKVTSNWDSRNPNLAWVLLKYGDVLKSCMLFVTSKSDFLQQITLMRSENKEFDEATTLFETKLFKHGTKGAVGQQLDQVHQNLLRYKILMLRYNEYLEKGSRESIEGAAVVTKLENIAQQVSNQLGLASNLLQLYDRFQGQFNVFEPGRLLLRQAEVLKQTRKETQPRHLVLFTDCLWLCRTTSSQVFDMPRSYRIPISGCRLDRRPHDDYACHLFIRSKVKSATVIFDTQKERDEWFDEISKAFSCRRLYLRRQSEAFSRRRVNNQQDTELPQSANEDQNDISRPTSTSRLAQYEANSQSSLNEGVSEEVSVPSTPIDDTINISNGNYGAMLPPSGMETVKGRRKKKPVSEVVKPLWLPDKISKFCLMRGCETEFSLLRRRHHCRNCGWLICSRCKGLAPLSKFHFEALNVCPECYERVETSYRNGELFPPSRLVPMGDGSVRVRIKTKGQNEIVDPRSLFREPQNRRLKKKNIDEKQELGLAFGKVYIRNKKGGEVLRYGLLTEDQRLLFYEAEQDSKAVEEVLVHGFTLRESNAERGVLFELIHRNQIRTSDTKDRIVQFRVDAHSSAKWSTALQSILQTES
ncbi:unnamed protein product [Caenorhabditis auriculariae]|uniref:FYVE, RhoGEF and PH domain-containing protein 6 n=1 Tax=Caenorhabditis auriculariae TaxID=2777116 RepID=A0A8S1H9G7_9PELO|nr:unnamed protein product [Caenorhabditis auriculariae]